MAHDDNSYDNNDDKRSDDKRSDDSSSEKKEPKSEPRGTRYGFARIDASGAQVDSLEARLPIPGSKKQPEAPPEAAADTAPVLRRVEHELAEPARLTAATHTGREILREQVEAGLAANQQDQQGDRVQIEGLALRPVKSEDLIKQDLLEAERPSVLQRGLQQITLTRLRLITALAGGAMILIGVIVILALRCGSGASEDAPPVISGRLPGEPPAGEASEDTPDRSSVGSPAKAAPAETSSSPGDYVVEIAAARKLVDKSFCQEASKMLLPVLRGKEPTKPFAEGYYLLGRALVCGGKEREGLVAYERALMADEARYRQDKALLVDMGYLLTRDKLQEPTIRLVVERIGKPAVEIMLAASTNSLQSVRAQAVAALERIGAADRIDWQTTLWLDLQQQPCSKRAAVIDKIAQKLPAGGAAKMLRAAARSPKQACIKAQLKQKITELGSAGRSAPKK